MSSRGVFLTHVCHSSGGLYRAFNQVKEGKMATNLTNLSIHALVSYVHAQIPEAGELTVADLDHALSVYNGIVGSARPSSDKVAALIRGSEVPGKRDIGQKIARRLVAAGPMETLGALSEIPAIGPITFARLVKQLSLVEDPDLLWPGSETPEPIAARGYSVKKIPYSAMSNAALAPWSAWATCGPSRASVPKHSAALSRASVSLKTSNLL